MSVEMDPVRSVEVPTRIVHGPGAVAELPRLLTEAGVTRPMIVTDEGVVTAGLADRVAGLVPAGLLFAEVRPNPDIALIDRAAAVYAEEGCDGLVAVGGGSPMDTAKSVGVVVAHGGSIARYEWGRDPITRRIPPLVAVPTTAGTGSEVTLWAVVTDPGRRIKFNVGGTALIGPHLALVDPELMLGLPPAITAATGMDAMSHGIECYTCDYHQSFNDAVALHAVELAGTWLERAVRDGQDIEARTAMAHAATLGGMAYGTESAGAAHAMSQSAGGMHDCSHGALTARLLPAVCAYNAPASPGRYARLARALGADVGGLDSSAAAAAGVEALRDLVERVGIPSMEELGFRENEIPLLARLAFEDPQTVGNPRELDVAAYEAIYCATFSGRLPTG